MLVARFGDKTVIGRGVLAGANSQRVGDSFWREGSFRETCVGGSKIPACCWLARRQLSEAEVSSVGAKSERVGGSLWREGSVRETCWTEKNHSAMVARLGEKAVIDRRVLVEATSQPVGGSLWREGRHWETCVGGSICRESSFLETCVGGCKIIAFRRFALLTRLSWGKRAGVIHCNTVHLPRHSIGIIIKNSSHSVGFEYVLLESHIVAYCTSLPPVATATGAGARARKSFNDDVAAEKAESRSSGRSSSSSQKYHSRSFHNTRYVTANETGAHNFSVSPGYIFFVVFERKVETMCGRCW